MADLPDRWEWVSDLSEGGQGHTFVVKSKHAPDQRLYVLKRLKNPTRQDRFEQEIQVCSTLDHKNILKVLDHGVTPKARPFLVTAYCRGGSLNELPRFITPIDGLRFFAGIVAGLAYAHTHQPAVFHLDIKPENILIDDGPVPLVGDFGICFVADNFLNLTSDGPHGSMYYCAPELRGPRIKGDPTLASSDVCSLGKVLYWLFTHDIYDGHEEDYGTVPERKLSKLFPAHPQFFFIDELIEKMIRRHPSERLPSADVVRQALDDVITRIEAGGHVLDLGVPQRCLYCISGFYKLQLAFDPDSRAAIVAGHSGHPFWGINEMDHKPWMALVCEECGNVQFFRPDFTTTDRWRNVPGRTNRSQIR
jgi:serine/threonine protein kinase